MPASHTDANRTMLDSAIKTFRSQKQMADYDSAPSPFTL